MSYKEWRRRNSILTITNKLLREWPQKRLLVSSVMPRLLIIMGKLILFLLMLFVSMLSLIVSSIISVILRNKMRKRKRGEGNK